MKEDVLHEQLKKGFIEATDIAEYMVVKGVPFREAHEIVGNLVKYCEQHDKTFVDVTKEDLQALGIDYGLNDLSQFTIENCIKNRNSYGGTSYSETDRQIKNAKDFVKSL